ncbi:MAG: hypothetical protein FJ194_03290 [Gammaproteobacteria bacterium]|nr:hypothetical protein [Gammaproteobacteria bacterium]
MNSAAVAPVIKQLSLSCSREHAFNIFTERLADWWPLLGHSCFGEKNARVEFDARVNGLVEEVNAAGERAT